MNSQDRRDTLVRQEKHSALLEGLIVSDAFEKDSDDYYVVGVISSDELVEITRNRFGLVTNS